MLDVKERFSKEQIIGFLRGAEAGLPIKELCRRHAAALRNRTVTIAVSLGGHEAAPSKGTGGT